VCCWFAFLIDQVSLSPLQLLLPWYFPILAVHLDVLDPHLVSCFYSLLFQFLFPNFYNLLSILLCMLLVFILQVCKLHILQHNARVAVMNWMDESTCVVAHYFPCHFFFLTCNVKQLAARPNYESLLRGASWSQNMVFFAVHLIVWNLNNEVLESYAWVIGCTFSWLTCRTLIRHVRGTGGDLPFLISQQTFWVTNLYDEACCWLSILICP